MLCEMGLVSLSVGWRLSGGGRGTLEHRPRLRDGHRAPLADFCWYFH